VRTLIEQRFPGANGHNGLDAWLFDHTDGQPLFVVALLEELVARGTLTRDGERWQLMVPVAELRPTTPQGVQQLIARGLDAVGAEARELLEVSSLCAQPFAVAAVAAALRLDPLVVEERCQALCARQLFLRPSEPVTWPDGTVTARFRFRHALYPT